MAFQNTAFQNTAFQTGDQPTGTDPAPIETGSPTFVRTTLYTSVYATPLALLLAIVAPPFHQLDWPNPRGAKPAVFDWEDSFKLPLQTLVPEQNYDWPNPRGPAPLNRGFTDSFKLPLQTLIPAKNYDWPVPKGPRRSGDLGWYDDGLASAVIVYPDGFFTKDWPNPVLRTGLRTDLQKHEDHLSIFDVPALQRWDSPLPPYGPRRVVDWVFSSPYALTSVVVADDPRKQLDWPNPRGAPRTFDLSWSSSFPLPLTALGQAVSIDGPTFVGPPGQFQVSSSPLTLLTIQENPRRQLDWPNPRDRQRSNPDWIASTPQSILGTIKGTAQYDWPNPLPPRRSGDVGFTLGSTGILTPLFPERRQYDWPVPKGSVPLNRGWTDSFKLPLQTLVPENQYNWPVPQAPRRNEQLGFTLGSTGILTPLFPAIALRDWPNPRGAAPLNRGWTDSFKLPLQTIRPAKQHDWPVPPGPRRITALGHIDRHEPGSIPIPVVVKPPAALFWPNPMRPVVRHQDFLHRPFIQLQDIVPLQPITGLKAFKRSLLVSTTGPNIVLGYPFPPPPEPIVPPLAKHSRGGIRSARSTTSSRWRKSRGNVRSAKSRTTPRDDP